MHKTLTRPALEIVFWFLAPALFLANYVFVRHKPVAAAWEHLSLIFLLAASVLLAKTLAFRWTRARTPLLTVFSAAYAFFMFSLVCYYIMVVMVFSAWGRVITEEHIFTYWGQGPELCQVAGVPYVGALAAFPVGYALFFTGCYVWQKRLGWLVPLPGQKPGLFIALLGAVLVFSSYRLYDRLQTPSTTGEPVSLTLFSGKPGYAAKNFSQGLKVPRQIGTAEEQARVQYQPAVLAAKPNLVLIVVDGLRYDHLGLYGYQRDTTPYLSGLARQGTLSVAAQVRSSCSETSCALASLASSRYSYQMPDKPLTLTEVLKLHGYQVRLVFGANHREVYDTDSLYGPVDDYFDGTMAKGWYLDDDGFILKHTRDLPDWDGHPVMQQFHLMAAHTLGKKYDEYLRFQPAARYTGRTSGAPNQAFTNYYDGGVVQTDAELKQLLATLEARHYLKDALVVITADHGESLGEHMLFAHTNSVREQVLHVPLMFVRFKDGIAQAARSYPQFSAQIDIAPTILHQLGMPLPSSWSGTPMQLGVKRDFTFYQMVPNLGLYDHRDPEHLWKFWLNSYTGEEFAFDLTQDPGENTNLVLRVPNALKASWRAQLAAIDLTGK